MPKENTPTKSPTTKKKVSAEPIAEKTAVAKPVAETSTAAASTRPKSAIETPPAAKGGAEAATKATAAPVTPAEKAVTKPAAKKTTARKESTPAKQSSISAKEAVTGTVTTIRATVDVGYGNSLYVRGEGAGLSWDRGVLMGNAGSNEWSWSTTSATDTIVFKFLINDEVWSAGDNLAVAPGETSASLPSF